MIQRPQIHITRTARAVGTGQTIKLYHLAGQIRWQALPEHTSLLGKSNNFTEAGAVQ